jgi:hypothetical protein
MIWLLSFIPYYVYILLIVLSLIAYFFCGLIKFDLNIKLIRIISGCVFVFSTFMFGYTYSEKTWKEKVSILEERIRISEELSKRANIVIQEKIIYRDKIIKEKADEIIKYIDRYIDKEVIKTLPPEEQIRYKEIVTYVENCPVPVEFIRLHNQATRINEETKK